MAKAKSKPSTNSAMPVSAFDLFKPSAEAVQRNLSNFVVLNLLPAAMLLGSIIFNSRHPESTSTSANSLGVAAGLPTYIITGIAGIGIIIFILIIIASILIRTMSYALQVQAAKDKTPDINMLWQAGKKYWLRLTGLGIVVALCILGGLILLIVPGIIFFRRYYLAPYVLIDKDTTILEAMRQSSRLSKPYAGSIWGLFGVYILMALPSLVPVIGPIVTLVLTVLYSVAPALRYEELKKLAKTT